MQNIGYDVKNNQLVDMFDAGIVDAAVIPKNAISAAISVAGTVLNADIVVPLNRESLEKYA